MTVEPDGTGGDDGCRALDSFPLTALQNGMLFHCLAAPHAGVYIQQLICDLKESLDISAFYRAWELLVRRHDALRTSFAWGQDGSSLQLLHCNVNIPWQELDWRDGSAEEQRKTCEEFLSADRRRGFDFSAPPLFRLTLCRLSENRYQLIWTSHHALFDGRSRLILLEELFEIYDTICRGQSPKLAPAASLRSLADWRLTLRVHPAETFWCNAFAGLKGPLLLDPSGNRSGQETDTARKELRLSRTLSQSLRSLAADHGFTLNTLIQGAWAILMSHYLQQRTVVFGATRAGRHGAPGKLADAVGLLINTLPVPVDVNPDVRLLSWLTELRAFWVTLRDHDHTSLAEITACLDVEPGAPLFDSLVVFEKYELNARLGERGKQWEHRSFRLHGHTNFPLVISGYDSPQILLAIQHDTQRFDDAVIVRMLEHLRNVLTGFVEHPECTLSEIRILGSGERHQLLVEWNDTAVDYPRHKCVHELFQEQVARTPDAVAVVFEDLQLSYRELNEQANQLAHHLIALGVGPETLVGLCLERSPELVVGILGILKAGGAYVPLDADYPPQRLEFMLGDAAIEFLVTQRTLRDRLSAHSCRLICLDSEAAGLSEESKSSPQMNVQADNLAYVMYTSGSTGQPKGVAIRHRSIARLLFGVQYVRLDAEQSILQLAPVSFDASTFEIWGALLFGGRMILAPAGPPDFDELRRLIARHQVSTVWLTAALFNRLLEACPEALHGVRQVLTGGEALSVPHVRLALEKLGPDTHLVNGYGPTECTTFACCYPIPRALDPNVTSIPIGRPIANTQAHVLDQQLEPVAIGVPGELYIGGAGLARGYLNLPELTAEKFVANPFDDDPNSRLYRTGDLCRWRADGNLEFLGRLDDQVKLRGFRIEFGEIEAVLNEHPDVAQSVVILREDRAGDKRLVAYCVPAAGTGLKSSELRNYLRNRLPEYMLPAAFVELKSFPLTSSGKIDRRALPAPDDSRPELDTGYVAPRNPIEEQLASIWCEVLGLESVGIHDNFFALGGHSLLATRVNVRIATALQVDLPLRKLFEAPTIAELSGEIAVLRSGGLCARITALTRVDRTQRERLPLSFAQQRLWFLEQMEGELTAYNIPSGWRLRGSLDFEALRRALEEIVRRHEPLRTTFTRIQDFPVQVIQAGRQFLLPVEDLLSLAAEEQHAEILSHCRLEAEKPFDLSSDLMLRASLLRLSEDEHVLLLTMHHIASDGWSLHVLWRELAGLYDAYCRGAESNLPELPVQYADYAVWQRRELEGQRLEQLLQFWREQLQDVSPLELPTDRPRPALPTYRGAQHSFELPEALISQLKRLSQMAGVTLHMTLLAAFQTLLSRYSGQDDIAVGVPVAGRSHAELEDLIGFFVNTLVLRTDLSEDPTFRELLGRVRQVSLAAYDHQDLPFEKLVEELRPERHLNRSPLVQVLFQLLNFADEGLKLRNLEVSRLPSNSQRVRFDLEMHVWQREKTLRGTIIYSTDLVEHSTIERMVSHFITLLEGIVAAPDQRVSELPLLTEEERYQLLVEWNDTVVEYPRDKCVHQLFEEQAARTPDSVAVIFDDQELTYRELNERANQLAHHLMALGVGPETLVGLCLERSAELVVSILGILKAGGAYVPLDPAFPRERVALMLADASPDVLVSRRLLLAEITNPAAHVVCLDEDAALLAAENRANPVTATCAENLAYVIYTSGSTGRPKGCLVTHHNVARLFQATQNWFQFHSSDVWTLFHSIAFDFSVWELWGALLYGGRLIIVPYWVSRSPDAFCQLLVDHQVTVLNQTPSAFVPLIDAEKAYGERGRSLQLRYLIFGGEALKVRILQPWFDRHGDCQPQLINMYGITETTVHVTFRPLTRQDLDQPGSPIGHAIPDLELYLLDSHGQLVPIGVPGEIFVGGSGVARGYLDRPELTAQRFIANPFSDDPSARLYRTGDLARWQANGSLEFLGRLDDQIKLRGFRIELGEIESVLNEHPNVSQSVVILREDRPGDKRLVAYCVSATGIKLNLSELRTHLRSQLPEYMQPAAFVFLDSLPLTSSGKVNRRGLPAPDDSRPDLETHYVAPRTPIEEQLASIWAEVLGIDKIGIHDNFFALGGHSLLATRVNARISSTLQVDLPLRKLFEAPTIAELALEIERAHQETVKTALDSFKRPLVALHLGSADPPLYLIHTASGVVLPYLQLASRLDNGATIYGIEHPGIHDAPTVSYSITDLATHHLELLRRTQPQGPYLLAGWSFGGLVAYELAQQLFAAGDKVALLALLDTHIPGRNAGPPGMDAILRAYLREYGLSDAAIDRCADACLATSPDDMLSRVHQHLRKANLLATSLPVEAFDLHFKIYSQAINGRFAYVPFSDYPGRVTLFKAADQSSSLNCLDEWERLRPGSLEVHDVPGNHYTMLKEPHVGVLAGLLQSCLDGVISPQPRAK